MAFILLASCVPQRRAGETAGPDAPVRTEGMSTSAANPLDIGAATTGLPSDSSSDLVVTPTANAAPTTCVAPPATAAPSQPPGEWRKQWREALRLYKLGEYAQACPLFRAAAGARGTNGALWGDLGLRELRWGHQDASVKATLLAVRHGDSTVRAAAYHNLGLASFRVKLPIEGCETLASTDSERCTIPMYACVRAWRGSGTVYRGFGAFAAFSTDEQTARQTYDGMPDLDLDVTDARNVALELEAGHEESCDIWCGNHPEYNDAHCTERCLENSAHEEPHRSCDVVFVDACNRRVGYACWTIPAAATHTREPRLGFTPRAYEYQLPSQ